MDPSTRKYRELGLKPHPIFLMHVSVFLLVSSSEVASDGAGDRAAAFTIQLENVKESEAATDLLNLFIRENENTLQINVTVKNRQVTVGRSRATP